jgi:hypothetical protein
MIYLAAALTVGTVHNYKCRCQFGLEWRLRLVSFAWRIGSDGRRPLCCSGSRWKVPLWTWPRDCSAAGLRRRGRRRRAIYAERACPSPRHWRHSQHRHHRRDQLISSGCRGLPSGFDEEEAGVGPVGSGRVTRPTPDNAGPIARRRGPPTALVPSGGPAVYPQRPDCLWPHRAASPVRSIVPPSAGPLRRRTSATGPGTPTASAHRGRRSAHRGTRWCR